MRLVSSNQYVFNRPLPVEIVLDLVRIGEIRMNMETMRISAVNGRFDNGETLDYLRYCM